MAVYGLQSKIKEKILSEYFGISEYGPDIQQKYIYLGLGLTQNGSDVNVESFNELYDGETYDGYCRTRCIFGTASNGKISNVSDIAFPTAEANWTNGNETISMLGIFDTLEVKDEAGKQIMPLAILKLPKAYSISAGETLIFSANTIALNLTDE